MNKNLLLGFWRHMLRIPSRLWKREVEHNAENGADSLAFMTPEHHLIRNLVVRELPRLGKPIPPEWIATQTGLALEQVNLILEDLEQHMTFLFRNTHGEVVWAYPVTVEQTPHQITFSSGEKLYAA
jgi:hypothetical protein